MKKNTQTDKSPFNLLSKDIVKALIKLNVIVTLIYNNSLEILRVLYKDSENKYKLNIN